MSILLNYYNTGTASVTNGTTAVTGVGTSWANVLRAGDVFTANGLSVRIASVTDDTHVVLAYNWPGTTLSGAPYEIRIPSPSADLTTTLRTFIETFSILGTESPTTLLGNPTGSAAATSAITLGANLAFSGTVLSVIAAPTFAGNVAAASFTPNSATVPTIGMYGTSVIAWATASTERMRLDGNGQLGLSAVPSAWTTSAKALEFRNPGNALWSLANNDIRISANIYYDGTNYKYVSTDFGSLYYQSTGIHHWGHFASGTAGASATYVNDMTLDASGNLALPGTVKGSNLAIPAPTVYTTGSGTYTTPTGARMLRVRMWAGGGGGGGWNGAATASTGGTSSFGSTTVIGGLGGTVGAAGAFTPGTGGARGTGGVNTGASVVLLRVDGQAGVTGIYNPGTTGQGPVTPSTSAFGSNPERGYGCGGGGAQGFNNATGGGGSGGAGEFVEFIINSPGASYSYSVGGGGAGSTGGSVNGNAGVGGAIVIMAFF